MEKKKEILIIGGSGVLSTAVVGLCIDNGWNVTMINRGRNTQWLNPKATLIKSDVNDDARIKAALGDKLEVPTLDGKVSYNLPEGTQTGTVFRLREKGIPKLKSTVQ